jgi:hypothetical protein
MQQPFAIGDKLIFTRGLMLYVVIRKLRGRQEYVVVRK